MQTLKKGSKGNEVVILQKCLNLIADGIFGVITDEAVRSFQKSKGLVVDGIVGVKTWAALGVTDTAPASDGALKKSKRKITKLIIHCTSSWKGQHWTVDQIRQLHKKERGWSDIGYHYVIYLDGSVHAGRPVDLVGAHTTGHNTNSIGIVYVGGLEKDGSKYGKPSDTRAPEQKASLSKLVDDLCKLYGLSRKDVYGHYEFANKLCPCFDVKKEFRS